MKKIIAVLLCLICIFSTMSMTASAGVFDDLVTGISVSLGMEPDDPILYGITYGSDKLLSGVTVMYMPGQTAKFTNPGTYTVTSDIPLSVDYEFVCWEDEHGQLYYPGDKIYIDGQKELTAVWKEKTDGRARPIRVIVTAIETLRRTLQTFFGVFKIMDEYVPDPVNSLKENDFFALDGLVSEYHNYEEDPRSFEIYVEPCGEDVVYEAFKKNDKIYFGGVPRDVEVQVKMTDENGNIVYDKWGNVLYETVVQTQLVGATEYSAFYTMKEDVYVDSDSGKRYQVIEVTLTDGVRNPMKGEYVTFIIAKGMLRYTDASGNLKSNKKFAFQKFSTTEM